MSVAAIFQFFPQFALRCWRQVPSQSLRLFPALLRRPCQRPRLLSFEGGWWRKPPPSCLSPGTPGWSQRLREGLKTDFTISAEICCLLDTMVPTGPFRTNTHLSNEGILLFTVVDSQNFPTVHFNKAVQGKLSMVDPSLLCPLKGDPLNEIKNMTLRSSQVCASSTQVQPDKPCDGCGPPVPLSHTPSSGPALPAHWESLTSGTLAPP